MKENKYKKFKNGVRRRTLFLLVLALIGNAFAWFIYSNKVSNTINAGVKSWKITFAKDGTNLESEVVFNVYSLYPGMPDFNEKVEIKNSGEVAATINYEIISVKIFDETFTKEDYTTLELEEILSNNYPFKTTFSQDNPVVQIGQTSNFKVKVVWPYESGDDSLDTYWGRKAYDFKNSNPGVTQIEIKVKLVASQ
ncbi:MAG: hypothetical protein IKF91_04595 [Bacilli bacterium]|nr:hypothetical protein [Bacilli bacterium]